MQKCSKELSGERNLATYFFAPFFLAGWLAWAYTALRVGVLSGLHRAIKACYRGCGSRYQIKDCCRAYALVWRSGGWRCARRKSFACVGACFKAWSACVNGGITSALFIFGAVWSAVIILLSCYQLAILCALCDCCRGMVYMSAGVGAVCDRYRGLSHSTALHTNPNKKEHRWSNAKPCNF